MASTTASRGGSRPSVTPKTYAYKTHYYTTSGLVASFSERQLEPYRTVAGLRWGCNCNYASVDPEDMYEGCRQQI